MLHHILPLIPAHQVYTEPFCGGAAVFFAKQPAKVEVINDHNDHLVNFYRVAKTQPEALIALAEATPYARSEQHRAREIRKHPEGFTDLERAWACWMEIAANYSHKFDAGFRYSMCQFTPAAPTFVANKKRLTRALARLDHCEIECIDALRLIAARDRVNAFHYLDPPYPGANQGHYKGYTMDQYKELLNLLTGIKGKFLLSNYPSDILAEYTQANGWYSNEMDKPNLLCSKNGKRNREVLVWNYELHKGGLFE